MRENQYLNRVVPECQITNKVNKEGDKRKHRSQKKNYSSKLMCMIVFFKESDTSQTSLNFQMNQSKLKLAEQKHGVNTMHTKTFVTFDMSFATP